MCPAARPFAASAFDEGEDVSAISLNFARQVTLSEETPHAVRVART